MKKITSTYDDVPYKDVIQLLYGTDKRPTSAKISKIMVAHNLLNGEMKTHHNTNECATGEDEDDPFMDQQLFDGENWEYQDDGTWRPPDEKLPGIGYCNILL